MTENSEIHSDLPSFEEVRVYAEKFVKSYIAKRALNFGYQMRKEMRQEAMERVWEAYLRLDAAKSWKAFIRRHCTGAVLDYMKSGDGFIQRGNVSETGNNALQTRIEMTSLTDGRQLDVEEVAGIAGVFSEMPEAFSEFKPKWELLARMAGVDEDLHIVCKVILGFTQEEIAVQIKCGLKGTLSRERISQRIYEMFAKFDSPDYYDNEWINQCIFALGLSSYYSQRDDDKRVGWEFKQFDLLSPLSFRMARVFYASPAKQVTFWDLDSDVTPISAVANRMVI